MKSKFILFSPWLLKSPEARKLEHHGPHALTVKYRESQHETMFQLSGVHCRAFGKETGVSHVVDFGWILELWV